MFRSLFDVNRRLRLSGVHISDVQINLRGQFVFMLDGVSGGAVKVFLEKAREVAGRVEAAAEHEVLHRDARRYEIHEDEFLFVVREPLFGTHAVFFREDFEESGFGHAHQVNQFVYIVCFWIIQEDFAAKV